MDSRNYDSSWDVVRSPRLLFVLHDGFYAKRRGISLIDSCLRPEETPGLTRDAWAPKCPQKQETQKIPCCSQLNPKPYPARIPKSYVRKSYVRMQLLGADLERTELCLGEDAEEERGQRRLRGQRRPSAELL